MPDEVTPGELDRRLRDHESRTSGEHRALDDRIQQAVQVNVWQLAERARDQQVLRLEQEHASRATQLATEHVADLATVRQDVIAPLVRRVEALEARPQMTFTNKIAVYGLIVAFIAVVIAAWVATKGAA